MVVARKKFILDLLETEISRRKELVEKYVALALHYKDASPSEDGDRAHAENEAELAKKLLANTEKLYKEIKSSPETAITKVSVPCFVELDDKREFYFVSVNLKLPGIQLLTPQSPLGAALLNKTVGQKISYEAGGQKINLQVLLLQ